MKKQTKLKTMESDQMRYTVTGTFRRIYCERIIKLKKEKVRKLHKDVNIKILKRDVKGCKKQERWEHVSVVKRT